jgi:hypothetical protein
MSTPNTTDRYRPSGIAPLRGPDLLVEHRSPARPQHPPRGLGSLRHHRPLRVRTPTVQHTRPDLRHLRPGRLPYKKQRRRNGLVAMVITVLGNALFLSLQGVSTFSAPEESQAVLAGLEEFEELPPIFANTVFGLTALLDIVLLGVAVWRSGILPKWAGAIWAAAHVLMYLSLVHASTIGPASTPPTVLVGAALVVISGAWMAWSVLRRPSSARAVGAAAQPRVR